MSEEPDDPNGAAQAPSILWGGEDTMEEDEAMPVAPVVDAGAASGVVTSDELISKIIAPSPYPHHITGPTSSRFRNALSRINTNPYDVEAWQALMSEANACWRGIQPAAHSVDAETHAKLDWMESCYGNLLKHFPYASSYWETLMEILMTQSARVGEEGGPYMDYGISQRARTAEAKLERCFRETLGIDAEGKPLEDDLLGGMCTSSVDIWMLYVKKRIRDANRVPNPQPEEKIKAVREAAVKAYDLAVTHTSFVYNNHIIWKDYLIYVKSWVPNPALNQDHALGQKQMLQLRSVYKRLVTHPMLGLDQLWQEYETFERSQNEALAAALIAEFAPKYQHARNVYLDRNRVYTAAELQMTRLATPPADSNDEDYASKIAEEHRLLSKWKQRCSYERTNPERLNQDELVQRVRQCYKEFACTCTRHPEVWHMWSTWEMLQTSAGKEVSKADFSIAVLQLGQWHIADCTLLSYAESQVVELYTDNPEHCLEVMENCLERSPNTLGFVLYQQMVRRYKGVDDARAVFSKARRILKEHQANDDKKQAEGAEDVKKEEEEEGAAATAVESDTGKRRMVTNRLDPGVGTVTKPADDGKEEQETPVTDDTEEEEIKKVVPGPITWQLYASHATMEHRLNQSPKIAARVYELGLRKHMTFLTKAPYIMRYAQLLLELQDTENLRALLTRAVAACEADGSKNEAAAALWDMTLKFESILSGSDPRNVSTLKNVESRRHAALLGPDVEDVSTGGLLSGSDMIQIGGQKTSLSEQLVRVEGYDVSSSIVNGMSRAVDVLEVMGLWGNDVTASGRRRKQLSSQSNDADAWSAGGKSDASYQRRLNYQKMLEAGESTDTAAGADTGSNRLSARERLQGAAGGAQGQSSAVALAIQNSPEWLRPLMLLLPASRLRAAIIGKPPPHLVEMALSTLRSSALPAERPADQGGSIPRKRQREGDDDSDDDDNGFAGGYGNQFRARQRARQMVAAGQNGGAH